MALGPLQDRRPLGVGTLLLFIQQLEGALGRGQGRLEGVYHKGGFGQRLGRLVDILEKGLHNAYGHGSPEHGLPGDDGNDHMGQPV